jgi:hypothetical protein
MQNCYAILFETGLLKVGRTGNILDRVKKHKDDASIHSVGVIKMWLAIDVDDSKRLEVSLIRRASENFNKFRNEYFSCVTEREARAIVSNHGEFFIECLDVKPASQDNCISLIVGSKQSKFESQPKYEDDKRVKKILKLIGENKKITRGVIINRLRPAKKDTIDALLDSMLLDKVISEVEWVGSNGRTFYYLKTK